ncbi:hypothetical protein BX666DRAFT_2033271 [Dichotomocladium elegans]|nr:hypothetical protein BX666DRAFT_2033271 [Dichotomocladium elegans]
MSNGTFEQAPQDYSYPLIIEWLPDTDSNGGDSTPNDPQLCYSMDIHFGWPSLYGADYSLSIHPTFSQEYLYPQASSQHTGIFSGMPASPSSPPLTTLAAPVYELAQLTMPISPSSSLFQQDRAAASARVEDKAATVPRRSSECLNQVDKNTVQPPKTAEAAPHSMKSSFATRRKDYGGVVKEKKKCMNCGATKTPTWRRGPLSRRLLCNACGLYEKVSGRKRIVVIKDGKPRIHRWPSHGRTSGRNSTPYTCNVCNAAEAKRWHIVHEQCFCDKCA